MGQKWLKRQQLPKRVGAFCYMGLCAMIFGWEVAQRVYLILRKQSESYLQPSWKYLCWHIVHFSHFKGVLCIFVHNFIKNFIHILIISMWVYFFKESMRIVLWKWFWTWLVNICVICSQHLFNIFVHTHDTWTFRDFFNM